MTIRYEVGQKVYVVNDYNGSIQYGEILDSQQSVFEAYRVNDWWYYGDACFLTFEEARKYALNILNTKKQDLEEQIQYTIKMDDCLNDR